MPVDKYIHANDLELHVMDWGGQGRPLVFVHGLSANCRSFDYLAEQLRAKYRVVTYDLRGRGQSAKPPVGYSLKHHAGDLAGMLQHLGLQTVYLAGHSLGAAIAVYFGVHYPNLVQRLVLIDGGIDLPATVLDSIRPSLERLGRVYRSMDEYLQLIRKAPFLSEWNRYIEKSFTYDIMENGHGNMISRVPLHVVQEELVNLPLYPLRELLPRIQCPTLVMRAPKGLLSQWDCLLTPELAAEMVELIPDSRLVEIPGTNHYTIVMGARPETARAIDNFLAK